MTIEEELGLVAGTPEYMRTLGFTKELVYFLINQNQEGEIIVQEFDFYADEMPCRSGKCRGSAKNMWLKVERGTLTKTCTFCRQTDLLRFFSDRKPAKSYKVSLAKAESIMRNELRMSTNDIRIRFSWLLKAKEDAKLAKQFAKDARPRPKKSTS